MDELSTAELRLLAEHSPCIVWRLDDDWVVSWSNSTHHASVVGRNVVDLVEPEFRDGVRATLWGCFESSANGYFEALVRIHATWDPDWFGVKVLPHESDGRQQALAVLSPVAPSRERMRLDVDEQRELAERMTHLGQVSGAIAHRFNNVLHTVLNHISLAQQALHRGGDPSEDLEEAEVAGNKAVELTSQLLAFDCRSPLDRKPLRLSEWLEASLGLLRRLLPQDVRILHEERAPAGWVLADAPRLQQVLINLCMNARDAMPRGGTIRLHVDEHDETLQLAVADEGTGMTPEIQRRAFEPFFTTKQLGRSTGLGLSIAYGIMEQHGGAISIDSRGSGTTVTLRLPKLLSPTTTSSRHASSPHIAHGQTILVADDDPQVRRLFTRVLRLKGYEVLPATSGRDVLKLLRDRHQDVDLAVLDAVMPDPSGEELYGRLRALRPALPVLFCSGYAVGVLSPAFLKAHGIPLLSKPFHPDELLSAVEAILGEEPTPPTDRRE